MFAGEYHTYIFFIASLDWDLNGNNICFNARVFASISDFAGCFHWENQMMASVSFPKESCSFESCSFQAMYITLFFFFRTEQETGDHFHCSEFQAPNRQLQTHAQYHMLLLLLWTRGPVVIYSPCCHKPNVLFNNFHKLSPSLLLFVCSSQTYWATPQTTPTPPGFRPDCSGSTPTLSFWWMIWAMASVVSREKKTNRYLTVAGTEIGYHSYSP